MRQAPAEHYARRAARAASPARTDEGAKDGVTARRACQSGERRRVEDGGTDQRRWNDWPFRHAGAGGVPENPLAFAWTEPSRL